jgi:hypothetical protein
MPPPLGRTLYAHALPGLDCGIVLRALAFDGWEPEAIAGQGLSGPRSPVRSIGGEGSS